MSGAIQPNSAESTLRLKCVGLADGDVVKAREIYAFVTGAADMTPRQRIAEALNELEGGNATPGR